jgi:hypothetical protein
MIDRQKLETVLTRRFLGASREQIAAAANAIMGLPDEWEEIGSGQELGYQFSEHCVDCCVLARDAKAGTEYRLLRRRS